MRWTPGRRSDDIEDRRGDESPSGGGFGFGGGGGGGGGGGRGGIRLGIGGTIVVLVLSLIFKTDLFSVLNGGSGAPVDVPSRVRQPAPNSPPLATTTAEEKAVDFVSFVLDDAQTVWAEKMADRNVRYRHAKLVLFRNATESACGRAQASTGPFYCPPEEKVFIDLEFFKELQDRFGASGDLAQAYVLAHELGHHVQKLMGTEQALRQAQRQHPDQQNALSVRMELQADCYAGIWANSAQQRNKLEAGDLDEALGAAAAVGDDRLQRLGRGHVTPESFTHGSSAQRMSWFKRGFTSGRVDNCDTFGR